MSLTFFYFATFDLVITLLPLFPLCCLFQLAVNKQKQKWTNTDHFSSSKMLTKIRVSVHYGEIGWPLGVLIHFLHSSSLELHRSTRDSLHHMNERECRGAVSIKYSWHLFSRSVVVFSQTPCIQDKRFHITSTNNYKLCLTRCHVWLSPSISTPLQYLCRLSM